VREQATLLFGDPVCNFVQTPSVNARILSGSSRYLKMTPHRNTSGRTEDAMHDSERYRYNAAECLLAAHEERQSCYRKLRLSMAASWLSLARQDEAMDDLLASWDTAAPVKTDGLRASISVPQTRFREPAIGRH
jgi:hypothetical protein